ncbi:hypothetical protein H4S01_003067 [Coemansia sp. RSA 2610]|nr:hypothetical protein H4S01_003067 [Coemansia sp. RSA 2610]
MRASLFPAVVQRTKTTADRVSTHFDEAHTIKDLPIGSLVMVRGTAARKLEPSNVGPFKIVAKIGIGSYALEDHTGAPLPRKYATSQLQLLADTVDENEDYVEIDAILGHRNYRSGKRYHVRWMDGDEGWVAPEDFGSLDIIHEYWDKLNASQN